MVLIKGNLIRQVNIEFSAFHYQFLALWPKQLACLGKRQMGESVLERSHRGFLCLTEIFLNLTTDLLAKCQLANHNVEGERQYVRRFLKGKREESV